jgi:hypothetical protein
LPSGNILTLSATPTKARTGTGSRRLPNRILTQRRMVRRPAPYRYVWPSELDLMAKIAGFRLRDRWAGWDRAPFTSDSQSQIAVLRSCRRP